MGLRNERKVTILDAYDCLDMSDRLRIHIDGPRDPSLVDIMSELTQSSGRIYFDGLYYEYNGRYIIDNYETGWYLDLFILGEGVR